MTHIAIAISVIINCNIFMQIVQFYILASHKTDVANVFANDLYLYPADMSKLLLI